MTKQDIFEKLITNREVFIEILSDQLYVDSYKQKLLADILEIQSDLEDLLDFEDSVEYAEMKNAVEFLDLIKEYEIMGIVELCRTGK